MNILIIGNGFDLAHELPTGYNEFLDTMICVRDFTVLWNQELPTVAYSEGLTGDKKEILISFCQSINEDVYHELKNIASKSFWIRYFNSTRENQGKTWMDFEHGIEEFMKDLYKEKRNSVDKTPKNTINNRILRSHLKNIGFFANNKSYEDLYIELIDDLNRIIRALSVYMDCYIGSKTKSLEKKTYITSINADKLLSFNYTRTYTELYGIPGEICYIHGKADASKTDNSMVLGFDDHYLIDSETIFDLVPFEKYYQRIIKNTDSSYIRWLKEAKENKDEVHIYIYGHSLSLSDGDVIKEFFLLNNAKKVIYYVNEADRARKVKNLAVILTPHKLIELTGSASNGIIWRRVEDE